MSVCFQQLALSIITTVCLYIDIVRSTRAKHSSLSLSLSLYLCLFVRACVCACVRLCVCACLLVVAGACIYYSICIILCADSWRDIWSRGVCQNETNTTNKHRYVLDSNSQSGSSQRCVTINCTIVAAIWSRALRRDNFIKRRTKRLL